MYYRDVHRRVMMVTCLFAACDVATKVWARTMLSTGQSYPLWPGIVQLTLTHNTGAAFSLFHHYPEILTGVAALMALGFLGFVFSRDSISQWEAGCFSLLLGGAIGNLADRLGRGAVTDFIDFVVIHYPIFNVADMGIVLGGLGLVWHYVRHARSTADPG